MVSIIYALGKPIYMCSVQDGITLGKANMRSSPFLIRFPSVCFWNGSNAGLIDSGPFSSLLRKIIKCFSSFASFWKQVTGETEDLFSINHILCMTEGPVDKINAAKANSPSAVPKLQASSSKLCQNWSRLWRGTLLKSLSPHSCPPTPSKRLGY